MRRRDGLLAALLATTLSAHAGDEPVRRGRTLRFPRDHGAHLGAAIEWWYITGDLHGSGDQRHGFQITFFRSRTGLAAQLDSRFAARHLLFAHAALTELAARSHLHAQRIARWSGDEASLLARASLRDTDLRLGGWALQRRDGEAGSLYTTTFGASAFELELQLQATQPLLLPSARRRRKAVSTAPSSRFMPIQSQPTASGCISWSLHSWSSQARPRSGRLWPARRRVPCTASCGSLR